MGLFDFRNKDKSRISVLEAENASLQEVKNRLVRLDTMLGMFDGEKTPGELGEAIEYAIDYYRIRKRGWESYIKSSVIQTAINNYCFWIVGSGLKFSSEPNTDYLTSIGINIDKKKFSSLIEVNFRLFLDGKESNYSKEMNIHQMAGEALKNAIISGDCLLINRFDSYQPTVQLVDGGFISTPAEFVSDEKVVNGVRIDDKGNHVCYYVCQEDNTYVPVNAYNNGTRVAWLMYGRRYKAYSQRGMSLLTAVLERDSKLDRYIEATVGSAEENSKIPYTFEHGKESTGENPIVSNIVNAANAKRAGVYDIDDTEANIVSNYARQLAMTTGKNVFNLPIGSKLSKLNSNTDPNFGGFFAPNADLIFSTIGIPPEVALSKYGGSYSGSRASIKSWEYKIRVERETTLTEYFYKPIYQFWFIVNLLQRNFEAPKYLESQSRKLWLITDAYTACRFVGQSVPHIDPVKEVTAERLKLGKAYENIPLQTAEQACENLNSGDYYEVQVKAEMEVEDNWFRENIKEETKVKTTEKKEKDEDSEDDE